MKQLDFATKKVRNCYKLSLPMKTMLLMKFYLACLNIQHQHIRAFTTLERIKSKQQTNIITEMGSECKLILNFLARFFNGLVGKQ